MAVIEIDWNPSRKMLRNFGLIGLVVFLTLASIVFFAHKIMFWDVAPGAVTPLASVLAALGLLCGAAAMTVPRALWPLYMFLTVVFYPLGAAVSYVMMAVIFYLIITPIGIVFKLIGRDSMTRSFDPAATTYWIKRRPPASVKRYLRQF